jgi:hypothetical protein
MRRWLQKYVGRYWLTWSIVVAVIVLAVITLGPPH